MCRILERMMGRILERMIGQILERRVGKILERSVGRIGKEIMLRYGVFRSYFKRMTGSGFKWRRDCGVGRSWVEWRKLMCMAGKGDSNGEGGIEEVTVIEMIGKAGKKELMGRAG